LEPVALEQQVRAGFICLLLLLYLFEPLEVLISPGYCLGADFSTLWKGQSILAPALLMGF
jgi:hypothetical protein